MLEKKVKERNVKQRGILSLRREGTSRARRERKKEKMLKLMPERMKEKAGRVNENKDKQSKVEEKINERNGKQQRL